MTSKTKNHPAFPTYPMTGEMGQTLVSFGLSKLELITTMLVSNSIKFDQPDTHSEHIINCFQIAESIIAFAEHEQREEIKKSTSIIK